MNHNPDPNRTFDHALVLSRLRVGDRIRWGNTEGAIALPYQPETGMAWGTSPGSGLKLLTGDDILPPF